MKSLFENIYKDRRVLITGHTGFKGSWLTLWLEHLGAKVAGYSLSPPTQPNHYDLLNLSCDSTIGDIRDIEKLKQVFSRFEPEIVFHLAAQPLVRYSYKEPKETFEVNVIGTVNVSDMCRITPSVKAIVNITSDKCYENKEWVWGYRENDPMGGYDPYSASKGCSELVTNAYRNSSCTCCQRTGWQCYRRRRLGGRSPCSGYYAFRCKRRESYHPFSLCDSSVAACA